MKRLIMITAIEQTDPVDEFWQAIELCKTDWDIEYYLLFKLVHRFRETLDDDHVIAQAVAAFEATLAIIPFHEAAKANLQRARVGGTQ